MHSDRSPLRSDYPRESTSVATWLICAIAGAFVVQFAADSGLLAPSLGLSSRFALSLENFSTGLFWTPLTFWLLHSTTNLFHVGIVLAGLLLLARELSGTLCARRFVAVFGVSVLTGAAAWLLTTGRSGGTLVGSTAGLYGLLTVYAFLHPEREVRFLLLFFFPVAFRPRHLAVALLGLDALAFFSADLMGRPLPFSFAPAAHLGGMLAGWTYCRLFHASPARTRATEFADTPAEAFAESTVSAHTVKSAGPGTRERSPAEIRAEVDRVLDKINSDGFGALTAKERQLLDDAKGLLTRR